MLTKLPRPNNLYICLAHGKENQIELEGTQITTKKNELKGKAVYKFLNLLMEQETN